MGLVPFNRFRGLAWAPQKLLNDESDEEEGLDTFSEDEDDMMPPDMDLMFQFFSYM